jgi:20S proteasome alpha/beta subunit
MSQLIACKSKDGIVLGADGKAVDVDANGNLIELKVDRLHQLSDHAAILNGGAVSGEAMCRTLKQFVNDEGLTRVDEIYQAALPVLATEYERFMRKACKVQPIDPIHQVTFILGGYTDRDLEKPFRLYLIWTKRKLPLLDSDEIASAFAVPRLIKVEHRLHQLSTGQADLDAMMTLVRHALEKQAQVDEEVSEPLSYAVITPNGFNRL